MVAMDVDPSASKPPQARGEGPSPVEPSPVEAHKGPRLTVRGLTIAFRAGDAWLNAVDAIDFSIGAGETLGLVGESGCGKSVTGLALLGLLPERQARVACEHMVLGDQPLATLSERDWLKVRGSRIAMIFQDPMASLHPVRAVGEQVALPLRLHLKLSPKEATARATALLQEVGIPDAQRRFSAYPHELSGGMRQRVVIAMALAAEPVLLVADEPTTALDVTIQAQILALLRRIQEKRGLSMLFISHDLAVVGQVAQRIAVMYAGRLIEVGPSAALLKHPRHPYTQGLLASLPSAHATPAVGERRKPLHAIPGTVPTLAAYPAGCRFNPRCPHATDLCRSTVPRLESAASLEVACFHHGVITPVVHPKA